MSQFVSSWNGLIQYGALKWDSIGLDLSKVREGFIKKREKETNIKISFRYVRVAEFFFLFLFFKHTLNRRVSLGDIWREMGKNLILQNFRLDVCT